MGVIALVGVVVGVVINFVNLHTDFQDLKDFHHGYLGRKMLISEGKLTSREYIKALKKLQESKQVRGSCVWKVKKYQY